MWLALSYKRAMMQDGGLNRKGFCVVIAIEYFLAFCCALHSQWEWGGGSSVGRHSQSLKAPPLLLPFNCCAIGWCIRVVREITLRLVAKLGL